MLEHVPTWLGELLRNVRAGHAGLSAVQPGVASEAGRLELTSPAFADGLRLPGRFTADGAGVSPPLAWSGVPDGTAALALIVEDPDAPAPYPLVHAILWGVAADSDGLAEGAISGDDDAAGQSAIGRNSYFAQGWLPPDPPSGHGSHDYVFQLFALSSLTDLGATPGRSAVASALKGNVLAVGLLVGTYARGDANEVLPSGARGDSPPDAPD